MFGCLFGHNWEVVSQSLMNKKRVYHLSDKEFNINVLAKIHRCTKCGKIKGTITTGNRTEDYDADYMIAVSEGDLHK